jgi:gamma-aminobutyric acid type B receptor
MCSLFRIRLFQKFKWKKITILQSVEEVFTSTAKDLERMCREAGIRVERQSFYGNPTDAIKTLVRQDARIIVGLFYATEARRVLCQVWQPFIGL